MWYYIFMSEWLDLARGPIDSDDEFNLAIIRGAGCVVLGRKSRGYGAGKIVLPGGKKRYYLIGNGIGIIPGTVDVSGEVFEETRLDIDTGLFTQAAMLFVATEDDTKTVEIHTAHIRKVPLLPASISADITDLNWHEEASLPYDDMPPDYKLWLPHVLSGYAVNAFFETEKGVLFGGKVYRQRLEPIGRMEMLPIETPSI
jgi:hypothetical protein